MAGFRDLFAWLFHWWSSPSVTTRVVIVSVDTTADMPIATGTTDAMYVATDTTADMRITVDTTGG